ncbi:MAG: hypothetical protein EA384_08285 [Spirochaetaceae bacterium]|nr:MAG: hypothetical protein EA384_08285 [Spirochaetaceae bacterium]
MRISTRINGMVALVVSGFLVILIGAGVAAVNVSAFSNLQLQMMRLSRAAYRLSLETNNVLASSGRLETLYQSWREAAGELHDSVNRVADHRGLRMLSAEARERAEDIARLWSYSGPRLGRLEEAIDAILATPRIPQSALRGINPTMQYALSEGLPDDTLAALNSAHATLLAVNESLMTTLVEQTEQASGEIAAQAATLQRTVVGAAVVAVLIVLTLALVLARSVARDLERFFADANAAMRRMSRHEHTVTAGSSKSVTALNQITRSIGSIKQQFEALDRGIAGSASAIRTIAERLNCLSGGLEQQTDAIRHSSASVAQLNTSIRSVEHTATERTQGTEKLRMAVQNGGERIAASNETVRAIAGKIDEILQVNEVINSISSQINLLSMNAAIESAHAGEAGRGFAVVAEEIRKLSQSTSENAKRIGRSLQAITGQIREALQSSDSSHKAYERISRDADYLAGAMDQIAAGMQELSLAGGEVSRSSIDVERISGEIRDGSQAASRRSNEISGAVQRIRSMSLRLVQGINRIDGGTRAILDSLAAVSGAAGESTQQIEELRRLLETFTTADAFGGPKSPPSADSTLKRN